MQKDILMNLINNMDKKMTRSDLIEKLARKFPDLTQENIEALVKTVFKEMSQAIINGDRVELRGFGSFSTRERKARTARNPKNGEPVKVGKRYAVYFRTGKNLRECLNP